MFNLFTFKGKQSVVIKNRQFTSPKIVTLPFNKELNLKYGDLIKIKGFIVSKTDIIKLMNEYLEFSFGFGESYFRLPFSYLININNIYYFTKNDETYSFIQFPHDYIFNHKIPIIKLLFSSFNIKLTNKTQDYNVEIVIDKYFLDNKERKELANSPELIEHNFRNVHHFKIPFSQIEKNLCVYKADIEPYLLTQGICIVRNCNTEYRNISITLNDNLTLFDYDVNLLNIYGEDVEKVTYYGFNIGKNYNSINLKGCINFSLFDKISITIKVKSLKETPDTFLDIYMPYWNTITYKNGLAGIKFTI